MKRILINATHNEEIRVALCKGNHLYDFDLENRTREQKKSNIYKAHVTRVEPSLEAVFVEYGAQRQGFLPIREIAKEYLKGGNPRDTNIRELIKEGDTLIVQVEKEERGNKGAALSTYVSLAGRYLVLMPNNPRGGGISRQISGKMREDIKRILSNLNIPKGMSLIVRTAGIGKTEEDLQHDLNHLINIWNAIGEQYKNYPSPRLVHQEAGVVTRAVRDYLRDDIAEVWLDNEVAYNEAANFISAVMPKQIDKLRKYTDYEPMFARFGIEKQIETAYQREVRLPSGGSIVIDQTEAMVAIDINSAKSTKGSDVAETAYHTNLEAADEIARQLRLRDMGGLVVIDFIDMYEQQHQKEVEKRLIDATKYDRARVQFGEISRFGLIEMSRQRLRPSLEESTGYKCPRCHGTGMVRDLRSLSLSIMRQIEQIALKERQGEVQAEVPTDIAAFLLNEKRDSLVYLEQDSGTRITILPHAHLESPHFNLHYNRGGFAPSSYERISDTHEQETSELGYDVNWQTADTKRPEQQPTLKPRKDSKQNVKQQKTVPPKAQQAPKSESKPQAAAWLSNLFAPTPQAETSDRLSSSDAAQAIEALVNSGAQSLGSFGQVDINALTQSKSQVQTQQDEQNEEEQNKKRRKYRKEKTKSRKKDRRQTNESKHSTEDKENNKPHKAKREPNSKRDSRGEFPRGETLSTQNTVSSPEVESGKDVTPSATTSTEKQNQKKQDRDQNKNQNDKSSKTGNNSKQNATNSLRQNAKEVTELTNKEAVGLSLDNSKAVTNLPIALSKQASQNKAEPEEHKDLSEIANNPATLAEQQEATVEANNIKTNKVESVDSKDSNKKASIDNYLFADIFADRYITAHKFAQAKNDPRVVRANLSQPKAVTAQQANRPIKGTVGEFIRATLKDAEAQLEQEGIIACFIQAIDAMQNSSEQAADTVTNDNIANFDFSNYGYAPLTAKYLANFTTMTQPVAQFNAEQGKTDVEPSAIVKRAVNDPRGQHPDYVEPEPTVTEFIEEDTLDAAVTDIVTNNDTKADESENTFKQEPDDFDAAFGHMLTEEEISSKDEAPAKALELEITNQQDSENADIDKTDIDQAVPSDNKANQVSQPEKATTENKTDDPEHSKTSFDKYRDMLANVSEQLSTKTVSNSLFLSTPTIPKTRSRKKKDADK